MKGSGRRAQAPQSGLGLNPSISTSQQCDLGQVPSLIGLHVCHSQDANCANLSRLYDSMEAVFSAVAYLSVVVTVTIS